MPEVPAIQPLDNPLTGLIRLQELQGLAQERQMRGQELQALATERATKAKQLADAQAAQQRANQILQGLPRNEEDLIDPTGAWQALNQAGVPLEHQKTTIDTIEGMNKSTRQFKQDHLDHIANVSDIMLKGHDDKNPVTPDSARFTMAYLRANGGASQDDEDWLTKQLAQGADPKQLLETARNLGSKWQKPQEYAASAGVVYSKQTGLTPEGKPVTIQPKTEAEQAFDAATLGTPLETSTAAVSAMAVKQRPSKTENEWSAFQQAFAQRVTGKPDAGWGDLTPQQRLQGLTQFKTIGPEASAAAAAERQAATIAQQIAQQGRAQAFTESQAGRKEYTDKVATPYQTALGSAQVLRDTVAAAKAGNKVAANLQSLETAMSAIRSQGLSRINMTEIGMAGDAGNLWDQIVGKVGKLTTGQSVPKDLQDDMLHFADILEKGATVKYQKGRRSLQQTYKGLDLPDESVAASTTTGTAGQKVGRFEIVGVK